MEYDGHENLPLICPIVGTVIGQLLCSEIHCWVHSEATLPKGSSSQ